MENNVTDSGSRLTRSLRIRLASVDSDNSSRLGSPVTSKLIPISEITASPSRSTRTTRSSSVSRVVTPLKTPAKRSTASSAVVAEIPETNTPTKRSTRKRGASTYEKEETIQTSLKNSIFATLNEETISDERKSFRITRSQSKSPQQIESAKASPSLQQDNKNVELNEEEKLCRVGRLRSNSPQQMTPSNASQSPKHNKSPQKIDNNQLEQQNIKSQKRRPGPKSKTCKSEEELEEVSDVEIITLEKEMEENKNKSENFITVNSTDDETNEDDDNAKEFVGLYSLSDVNEKETNITSDVKTSTATRCEEKQIQDNIILAEIKRAEVNEEQNRSIVEGEPPENLIANVKDRLECDANNVKENEVNSCTVEDVKLKNGFENCLSSKDCKIPLPKESSITNTSDKVEILSISTVTPCRSNPGDDSKTLMKKVDFISSSSNDIYIKSVYPKTPSSTKSTNCLREVCLSRDGGLFQSENNVSLSDNQQDTTNTNFEGKVSTEITININEEKKNKQLETIAHIEPNTDTPTLKSNCAHSLQIAQNSTLMNSEAEEKLLINNNDILLNLEEKQKDENINIHLNELLACEENLSISMKDYKEMKWINPSVRGITLEGSKLDALVSRTRTKANECFDSVKHSEEKLIKKDNKTRIIFSSEDEEEGDVLREEDRNESGDECELAPGEKPYKRRHDFHDDDVVTVCHYESGDSMDSEERREIEENEVKIDGDSIDSHTTEDEHDEYDKEDDTENSDSFIVSDTAEIEFVADCNDEEEQLDEDMCDSNRKKKKSYRRVRYLEDNSSSSDEEVEVDKHKEELSHDDVKNDRQNDVANEKDISFKYPNDDYIPEPEEVGAVKSETSMKTQIESSSTKFSSENIALDSIKLSDSALRLQYSPKSNSELEEIDESKKETVDISRKQINCKLNQSDRFNSSIRNLNLEIETFPTKNVEKQYEEKEITETIQENGRDHTELNTSDGVHTPTSPNKSINDSAKFRTESHLGEVSVTSESDADKENVHKSLILHHQRQTANKLSVSFGNYKKTKKEHFQEEQRSFIIDVPVNRNEDLDTTGTGVKLSENTPPQSLSKDSASCDAGKTGERKNENISYQKNIRHIPLPLGNPLIRTRRQSLALPTNPNMEICSSTQMSGTVTKPKRKSFGVLLSSEFYPSQSFIDSIELHANELNRHMTKRKRLSKSFCGATDALENSIVDIDVQQLHKKSKLTDENSMAESRQDSIENINTSKLSTKPCSTPYEKTGNNCGNTNNNIRRILSRCDEILEAANRAKLEAKMNNKKSKVRIAKRPRKKSGLYLSSETSLDGNDDLLRKVSRDIKRKDKTRVALSQAIKTADVITNRKKNVQINTKKRDEMDSKRLPSDVLQAIEESTSKNKKNKIETSVGYFLEMPQTPKKKKKKLTYIQLPTGKVSVEPVTPKRHSVQDFNGDEFRESPITPNVVGFKVRQIPLIENNSTSSYLSKNHKRKRYHEESDKKRNLTSSQWTQSGPFLEEDIPKCSRIGIQERRKCLPERQQVAHRNFKESALMRPDVKRCTNRDKLLLIERRQIQGYY